MNPFYRSPTQFAEAVTAAVEIHRRISEPTIAETRHWLTTFLEQLVRTPPDKYPDLAASLRLSQLRMLARLLGQFHGKPGFMKVFSLLLTRPMPEVCTEFGDCSDDSATTMT